MVEHLNPFNIPYSNNRPRLKIRCFNVTKFNIRFQFTGICLGEIVNLIHALEKRYYQNETEFRYNFAQYIYNVVLTLSLKVHIRVKRAKIIQWITNHYV